MTELQDRIDAKLKILNIFVDSARYMGMVEVSGGFDRILYKCRQRHTNNTVIRWEYIEPQHAGGCAVRAQKHP